MKRPGVAALVLGCALGLQACSGLTVTPTGPSSVAEPLKQGSPTVLTFSGTLEDGGSFSGYILYGSRDIDARPEYGRFQAAYWKADVIGGATTKDVHFADTLGGRALIETYNTPFPTIGLVFLWPREDPSVEALTPHFYGGISYNPDQPPALSDFGPLLPGSLIQRYGIYRDGQGGETIIRSVQFERPIKAPSARPAE